MLFFTKICIAVQSIDRERSMARWTPPPIDIWAPRRISECGMRSAEWGRDGDFLLIPHSAFRIPKSLESLRMPVRLRDAAFAFVFEKFVHRGEDDAGAAGF